MTGDAAVDEEMAIGPVPYGDGSEIMLLVEDDEAVRELPPVNARPLCVARSTHAPFAGV